MKNRDIVGAIIVNEKNEILLQKKTFDYKFSPGGCWTFFGGEIKGDESPEQTLKREIKEEINYDIKNFYLFKAGRYKFPSGGLKGKKYIFVVFFDGDISQISLREGGGFGFFSTSELNYIKIQNLILRDLKEYINTNFKKKR
ncbi:MAG: NUDIX hydrolase [Nanoarchaeota archaeon]|nr:NUDIX hydrolase [Nanoarchaeota archaeon]MCG2719098.1 NUDIX hydrolase [Nanoarchaeota archaeon]